MNTISNIRVTNLLNNRSSRISWNQDTDPSIIGYKIYRGAIPYYTQNYALIGTVGASVLSFNDTYPLLPYNSSFYCVTAYNNLQETQKQQYGETFINTNAWVENPITDQSPYAYPSNDDMNFFMNEILRRNLWMLENDGEPFKLLKRMYEGTKCPLVKSESEQCPNPLGKPVGTNVCYGTGFLGGFYPSLEIKIRVGIANSGIALQGEGYRISNKPKMWTLSTPNITTGDLLISQENKRYLVVNTLSPSVRGIKTHTDIETELIPPNNMLMKVQI